MFNTARGQSYGSSIGNRSGSSWSLRVVLQGQSSDTILLYDTSAVNRPEWVQLRLETRRCRATTLRQLADKHRTLAFHGLQKGCREHWKQNDRRRGKQAEQT